jgi:hypothetical protein
MTTLLEILKYILPALIVFFTCFYIINKFFKNEEEKRKLDIIVKNHKLITPIKLQAYERLILLLERISPESLIMRVNKSKMNCMDLQAELLNTIRAEFEHNFSQQLYISSKAWENIKNARGNMIKLINTVADSVDQKESSLKLSQGILEKVIDMKKTPTYDAIEFLKKEMQEVIS